MFRRVFFLALSASALLAGEASAQIIFPTLPQVQKGKVPNLEPFPLEVQQQLQQIFEQAAMAQKPGKFKDGSISWGGLRLTKTDAVVQLQLGLGERDGMIVLAVDPKSAAEKAGLKAGDVLVKINDQAVPSELDAFTKLVKDQKVDKTADLVVVRNGKEETLKAAKMPTLVQYNAVPGVRRPAIGFVFPNIQLNPRPPVNPLQQGTITKLHMEMTVNGAKVVRKQENDLFSGEYSKDDLKITLSGKIENGRPVPGEVTVTEGKETKKYTSVKDVPAQHQPILRALLPTSPINNLNLMLPNLQNLQNFPGVPVIPGIDD